MANYQPRPNLPINVPAAFPTRPEPGKIRILYDANKKDLYHKLSPYGSETFLGIKSREPFLYTYPDEVKKSSRYQIVDIATHSANDVKRIAKFMTSGAGILWSGTQFLLQTGNAFNETRIWNPTSPIVAAGMGLTLGAVRPQRHIDTGNILGSILGSVGSALRSIVTSAPPPPPVGTVGQSALPSNNIEGGKGLLRAGTANAAKTILTTKWQVQSNKGLGVSGFIGEFLKTTFGNFIPQRQTGVSKRADEITYGLMLNSGVGNTSPFTYIGPNERSIQGVQQFWYAGNSGEMRQTGTEIPSNWTLIYTDKNGNPVWKKPSNSNKIRGVPGNVGFQPIESTQGYNRYGDYVGVGALFGRMNNDWEKSNMLIQYSMYATEGEHYSSKFSDHENPTVTNIKNSLQRVIKKIQENGVYAVTVPDSDVIMGISNGIKTGYDRLSARKNVGDVENQYVYSVLSEYRNARTLEANHSGQAALLSKKMASSNQFDGINTLQVLEGDRKIENSKLPGWTEWKPYDDDIIAFYFYDVVNDKYIPFRATVRGLQETDSVNWEEMTFIGRADKLYSYNGFNRTLSFSFTVNINSILELAPTWQRINYLMGLTKPANYTVNTNFIATNTLITRYIVPPMVLLTIGDMYKQQPIVIASAGIIVPDTALWETLNEENSSEWSYLIDYIKAPSVKKRYGQLPKTVDISITANLLEKERPIVGMAHFNHAPHEENYIKDNYRKTMQEFTTPTELGKSLIVYQDTRPSR